MEHASWPLDRLADRMVAEDQDAALAMDIVDADERVRRARLAWDAAPDEPARRKAYYAAVDARAELTRRKGAAA